MRMLAACLVLGGVGCAVDDHLSETSATVLSENKLAANKLAANKLSANKLSANKLSAAAMPSQSALIDSADGREVLTYIVRCALPQGQAITVKASDKTDYVFAGELGLAPGWATHAPTVSERRWVTACVLARTNYYGQSVGISLRGSPSALATTAAELSADTMDEAAFYGDLFDPAGATAYVCQSHRNYNDGAPAAQLRKCAVSTDGVTSMCGFTYTGFCHSANECSTSTSPYAGCHAGKNAAGAAIPEVITVYLAPN
jgi:hypothetical protein